MFQWTAKSYNAQTCACPSVDCTAQALASQRATSNRGLAKSRPAKDSQVRPQVWPHFPSRPNTPQLQAHLVHSTHSPSQGQWQTHPRARTQSLASGHGFPQELELLACLRSNLRGRCTCGGTTSLRCHGSSYIGIPLAWPIRGAEKILLSDSVAYLVYPQV